jgi:hypothetical protein
MHSSQAISFVIRLYRLYNLHDGANVQSMTLENIQTNEKLVIKRMVEYEHMTLTISRYPMEANEEWIKGMGKDPFPDNKYRYITIEI